MFEKNSLNNINTLIWQELCQIKCTNITIIIAMTPEEAFFFKKKNCLQIFFEFIFGAFSLKLLHGSKFYFVHISIFKFF